VLNLAEHLPALLVVLPLVAAPLIVLVRHMGAAWILATLATWACFAMALAIAWRVQGGGVLSYAIGSWPPPWGIELRIDALNAFVLVLVSGIGSVVLPYARTSVAAELPREQEYLFFAMYCLALTGLLGIAATGDAFNLFVFLEVSSLATYVLVALGTRREALVAAYQYLIMGTIGATFYIIGVGLLYLVTGTLNLADLAARLPAVPDQRPVIAGLAFITAGIGLKLAMFPLHQWLPSAYAHAPSAITAFLAATATKVSVYVLIRFWFVVYGGSAALRSLWFGEALVALSVVAILAMSVVALMQPTLKRMLAYSSISQVGYITLGIAIANVEGLTASIAHLFNHGITKGALFLLAGGVALRYRTTHLEQLAGLGHRMPLTALGIVLAGLGLAGLPGTAGFTSKWYLVAGAIAEGRWLLVGVVLLGSVIAVAYVWRFVEIAWLRPAPPDAPRAGEAPLAMLVPAVIAVLATLWFGFATSFNIGYARDAASALLAFPR